MNNNTLSTDEKKKLIDDLDLSTLGTHPYSVEIDYDFYGTTLNLIERTHYGINKIIGITVRDKTALLYAVTFIRNTVKKLITNTTDHEH